MKREFKFQLRRINMKSELVRTIILRQVTKPTYSTRFSKRALIKRIFLMELKLDFILAKWYKVFMQQY